MAEMISQIALAAVLRVTDRRVRQLVDERILPPARTDGYDVAVCEARYRIFSSGSEADWDEAYLDAERLAIAAKSAVDRAMGKGATVKDVTSAVAAVTASTDIMAFLTAAKSKSDAERELFWKIWNAQEDDTLRALIARAIDLGATHFLADGGEKVNVPKSGSKTSAKPVRRDGARKAAR